MNPLTPIRIAALTALLLTGCDQSSHPVDAQSSPIPHSTPAAALPTTFTTLPITDPAFDNMTAGTLTVPSGWKMQGIMMRPPCSPPSPVMRAYSPDGLTEMRIMPALGWTWSDTGLKPHTEGCMQMNRPLTARELIDHYLETIPGGVHVVGPMPVPPDFSQHAQDLAAKFNQNLANSPPALRADNTADTAALRVQTHNGTFLIEQRLLAEVQCSVNTNPGPFKGGHCYGVIRVLRTPEGKLDALAHYVDSNNLPKGQPSSEWLQASLHRQQLQGQAAMAALTRQENMESNMLRQQYEQFRDTQARNHAAFMQQQESSFRSSMNAANNAMNARSTAASDWVDYALDQQTVTGQGGTVKVSSSYSQTWSSTVGNQTQWYQTNDPNSNPNGTLPGNWTQDTKVHGNGQPY